MFFLAPKFWRQNNLLSRALLPASWGYEYISHWYGKRVKTHKVSVPVICVGNLVMGGAGKTPTVIALVDILKKIGHTPHILSRGYGAVIKDSIQVDIKNHTYLQVGDEALLLAEKATTWAGEDRVLSAKLAISHGASVIIMDDGLQNYSLHKDLSLLVVDTLQGFGNGKVFPAGPLRESPQRGVRKAAIVVAIGDGILPKGIPSATRAYMRAIDEVNPRPIVAFAGLGYPEKFNRTLLDYGFDVKRFIPFPDHHPYTIPELERLVKIGGRRKIDLMTTAKDFLRIPERFKKKVSAFNVQLEFDEPELFYELLTVKLNSEFGKIVNIK
jgi:tetraacyldisaccharide 4'-kinase